MPLLRSEGFFDSAAAPSPESGADNSTKYVALNGDQGIDGLLTTAAWAGNSIQYSFPTSGDIYGYAQYADLPVGFFGLTAAQRTAVYFALDADLGTNAAASAGFSLEGITNLGVSQDTTPETEQIRLANTTAESVPTAQVADFPGNYVTTQTQDNGDVWFGTGYDYTNPVAGSYAWHTHIHEIGHALGLKHGHEQSLDGPMPANVDSMEYSVMTYRSYVGADLYGYANEQWGYAQTWMMYDIAALQHMYGADFTTNSGATTYKWTPGSASTLVNGVAGITPGGDVIFATIWDGGGTDTYDLSSYQSNLSLDLTPGGYSVFSDTQRAYLGGGPNGGYARGNIFNALQYHGDARSLIENAVGGSGNDAISGNAAANALSGNAGNDTLRGNTGNDVLRGGAGGDSLYGDAGVDTMYGDGGNDIYYVDAVSDMAIETLAGTAGGADIVYSRVTFTLGTNVETLRMIPGSGGVNGTGNALNNEISGTSATNTLRGMAGADRLDAGGAGDVLIGGTGADVFLYLDTTVSTSSARDTIRAGDGALAFEGAGAAAGDRFDLSGIDANTSVAGVQDFIFGTSTGIGRIWAVNVGADTLIRANVNSSAAPEFELKIEDGAVLASAYSGADFIL